MRIITKDGRKEVYSGNVMIAYVDPDDDFLYRVDATTGHAFPVCECSNDREILEELNRDASAR